MSFFLLPEILVLSSVHMGGNNCEKSKQENLRVDRKLVVKKEPESIMLFMCPTYIPERVMRYDREIILLLSSNPRISNHLITELCA